MHLGGAIVVEKQHGDAGVPLEAPIVSELVLNRGEPFAGLAGITQVDHGTHHAERDFCGFLVLRGLHGLTQRFEGFLRLRVGSTLQERGAHVGAVHQGRRQRRDHLGGGDAHGAVDAVNQLVRAKDQVLGAEGRTLWGKQRVLRGMLNAIAQGDDLAEHTKELVPQLRYALKALGRIWVRGAQQQPVEGEVAAQQRLLGRGGQSG